jgi:hypothetical protein
LCARRLPPARVREIRDEIRGLVEAFVTRERLR